MRRHDALVGRGDLISRYCVQLHDFDIADSKVAEVDILEDVSLLTTAMSVMSGESNLDLRGVG